VPKINAPDQSGPCEEGPSGLKGKGIDPRNWGDVHLNEEEAEVEVQQAALDSFSTQKSITYCPISLEIALHRVTMHLKLLRYVCLKILGPRVVSRGADSSKKFPGSNPKETWKESVLGEPRFPERLIQLRV